MDEFIHLTRLVCDFFIDYLQVLNSVIYCLRRRGVESNMKIIIQHNSMVPIYEQLINKIKKLIVENELKEQAPLPSVRTLAKELRISALTVKKAYDLLEKEGFITTVHGKGSFVLSINKDVKKEEMLYRVQEELEKVISKAKHAGISKKELQDLFLMLLEDE